AGKYSASLVARKKPSRGRATQRRHNERGRCCGGDGVARRGAAQPGRSGNNTRSPWVAVFSGGHLLPGEFLPFHSPFSSKVRVS
ncbi:Os04g0503100, partial [Oryza sativa Japonica Group]